MTPILALEDITARYDDRPVLEGADLTVDRGDFISVTGPNGGGKTTLLRVMLGLLKPSAGKVVYYNNSGAPTRRLRIGYLPQKNKIDTRFPISVAETVRSGLISGFFGCLPRNAAEEFERVVAMTDIAGILGRPIGDLSGGQLQRSLLARALICRPELLVLDEPLSYVDKSFELRLYTMLGSIAADTTVILVSHETTVFDRMANRHLTVDRAITQRKID